MCRGSLDDRLEGAARDEGVEQDEDAVGHGGLEFDVGDAGEVVERNPERERERGGDLDGRLDLGALVAPDDLPVDLDAAPEFVLRQPTGPAGVEEAATEYGCGLVGGRWRAASMRSKGGFRVYRRQVTPN